MNLVWRLLSVPSIFFISVCQAQPTTLMPENFSKVSEAIYRGGRPSEDQLGALQNLGIKQDLSLQGGDLTNSLYYYLIQEMEPGELPEAIAAEANLASQLGMQFLNVPLDSLDPFTTEEDAAIDQVLGLLNSASVQSPIYLHCEHGKDRTGLVIALYRIQHDGWTPKAAFDEWEVMGHDDVSQFFTDDLDSYFAKKSKELRKAFLHPEQRP